MIAEEPTMATSSGGSPARIAGTTKKTSSANVTASPARAAMPRHRPKAATTRANTAPSTHSPVLRWWSTIA